MSGDGVSNDLEGQVRIPITVGLSLLCLDFSYAHQIFSPNQSTYIPRGLIFLRATQIGVVLVRFFLVILQWVVFVGRTHLVFSAMFLGPHHVFTFFPQSSPAASPFLARGEQDQKILVEI